MNAEPPTPANDDDDPWTDLFGASLALETANDLDEIAATLKDAQRAFPEPVEQPPEAYPVYAVSRLLRALLDAISVCRSEPLGSGAASGILSGDELG